VRRSIIALAAAALMAGAAFANEAELARGAELLAPFKRELQTALREGLAEGPSHAIGACRLRGPQIGESLSRDGVRVGRTSHRLRNPANASPEWVQPILDAYLANADDRAPRVAQLGEGRAGYVEPIVMQPLCESCHGDPLSPDLVQPIRDLYPEDRAVGFHAGELRGVFWVEFPRGGAIP